MSTAAAAARRPGSGAGTTRPHGAAAVRLRSRSKVITSSRGRETPALSTIRIRLASPKMTE